MESPEQVLDELAAQVCGCVYWRQSVEQMVSLGADRFIEFGPGKVLTGLAKRIAPEASAAAAADLDAISELA